MLTNSMVAKKRPLKPSSAPSHVLRMWAATDRVELSGWKDEVAGLKERTESIPEVDEEKVARVKQALDSGTYTADSKKVARSILKDHLLDEIV